MNAHRTHFEATAGGLVLTNAILLYRGQAAGDHYGVATPDAPAFASMHAVEHDDGRPMIAAGTPLTRAHLRQWAHLLGKSAGPEILPANVLVSHADMLAWWVPGRVRPAYFNLTKRPPGLKALSGQVVVPVPYPAHVFVATRRALGVYALSDDTRPSADTKLLFSPILNVFISGHLCWGNVPQPKSLGIAAIPEFERAVFDSWSTHPNAGQEQTVTSKGGLVRLWDGLAARKATRFPVNRLKPFHRGGAPITLGKLIAGAGQ
jgi:PRTRC genetic system protein B